MIVFKDISIVFIVGDNIKLIEVNILVVRGIVIMLYFVFYYKFWIIFFIVFFERDKKLIILEGLFLMSMIFFDLIVIFVFVLIVILIFVLIRFGVLLILLLIIMILLLLFW